MPHPDFSGTWTVNLEASRLGLDSLREIECGEIVITQADQQFSLSRTFSFRGEVHRAAFSIALGASGAVATADGRAMQAEIEWRDDEGTLTIRIHTIEGNTAGTNSVTYRLAEGGRRLEANEVFSGPALNYVNFWVLERPEHEL
jgi:hypothetical protein